MTNEPKYLPATEKDLRIGQVVEVYEDGGIWKKTLLDYRLLHYIFRHSESGIKDYLNELIRIPMITHEDIVAMGWKLESVFETRLGPLKKYKRAYNKVMSEKYLELNWYFKDEWNIVIHNGKEGELYGEYKIQTPLQLSDLMEMLGIEGE